ncbi:MAG: glycosyl hydrolase [Candidatus Freyarchaeota archaeon]
MKGDSMENEKNFVDNFRSVPKDFGPVPFWFLNNELPEEDIDWFLQELVEKGNSGVFLHPRTGLEVEYLSQSFWGKISYCVEACRRLGLKAWLYDEYNWPSGVVGGRILREHPEYAQHYLDYRRERVEAGKMVKIPVNGRLITAVAVSESGDEIISLKDKVCVSFLEFMPQRDNWYVAVFTEKTNSDLFFCTTCAPWARNERGYLDLLSRDAVRCFINYTHEEYRKRLGKDFGDLIPGIFTDEPANYRGLPWTGNFLEEFKKRKGYSLEEKMHELAFNVGDYVKTRCDYFGVVSELFSEAFYGQIAEWCRENGLKFTGHLFEEEELETVPRNHGNVYTALKEMDIPGLDWLGVKTGYEEIPLIKAPCLASKIVSSIAHATGKKSVLCEYGGGNGWNTTLMSLKNLVNYLQATGVNFMNSHAAYLSIKGLRKRDFPPSHFVQEPWWKHYATFSSYISRLSYLNSSGTHIADVLLLYPLRSLWAEYTLRGKTKAFEDIVKYFGMIGTALLRIQRDYDILFEDEVLDSLVSVDGNLLRVADEEFRILILPPMTTIPAQVLKLVKEFFEKGGIVVGLGFLPTNSEAKMNDPQIMDSIKNIFSEEALNKKKSMNTSSGGGKAVFLPLPDDLNSEELEKILRDILNSLIECDLSIDSPHSRNLIYLHRRIEEDEFYFLANLSEEKVQGEITLNAAGRLEKWVPETGEILPVHVYRREGEKTIIPYTFEPCEGVYFVVRKGKEYRHLTYSNVNVTGIYEAAQKIMGYSRVSEPKVIFEGRGLTAESQPLLEPIIIFKWSVEVPTNYMILEPWKVIVGEDVEPQKGERKKDENVVMVGRSAPMEDGV